MVRVLNMYPNFIFFSKEEQQDTGWSSFKWRNYDPTDVRFFNVDPLAEKYAYQSPFNFSENKVISHRELEGLEAIDAKKVREVFDNGKKGKSYQLVIHVDQPGAGGDRDIYEPGDSGHAFITLNRKNTDGTTDSKTFGYYPYPQSVNPIASEADGKIKDNLGHEQEVVQTRPITEGNFNAILDFVESKKNTKYDLNTNNCTDFVINGVAAGGVKLPKTKGSFKGFSGSSPGNLGEDLRSQNKNIRKGKSPEGNQSKSKNKKNKDNDKKIGF